MNSPWWLTRGGWQGYWVAFRASFDAGYRGASEEQWMDEAKLATYRWMRTQDPTLTWDRFQALARPVRFRP